MQWIAIDPGKRTGYAIVEDATIIECGTGDITVAACHRRLFDISTAVIEFPRVYPNVDKWKGDPQIIVKLAFDCGIIAGFYEEYVLVEPREWGGSMPKPAKWKRTLKALTKAEREALPKRISEHARDAIGIACWAMGRFARA